VISFETTLFLKNIFHMHNLNMDNLSRLDVGNPEQMIYDNGILRLTVLGGIRLDGLDRMRVTLKIEIPESPRPPLRHNLDLYNDVQVEKLVRKVAERMEIGTNVTAASFSELTECLEQYRVEEIKKSKVDTFKPKALSQAEQLEAEEFLKGEDLMKRTNELIGQSGILGEEINRLIMYLIFTSRKRQQPLHVVSLGASGTGKTHLQEKVGELIPEEDKIEITTLSENAFYYFGQRELKNKLIMIEDLDGAENVLYPLRELQSKKRISKTIAQKNSKGETRSVHLVVEGPVSVSGCTTQESIYEDNANRSFLLYLDESKEQDARIMEYQRKLSAGKIDWETEEKVRTLLKNCQRILEPVKVINPFAELLEIPTEVLKPRRTNNHYLQFIEAVTFYHQRQRVQKADEQTGEIFIETTLEDIAEANKLLSHVLLRKSDQITGACRNHFERLKLFLVGSNEQQFSNMQISQLFRIPLTTVKRYHLELVLNGYLKSFKKKGSNAHVYEVVSYQEYQDLQKRIATVLDERLEAVQQAIEQRQAFLVPKGKKPTSPHQPTKGTGLSKRTKTKELSHSAQSPEEMIHRP
jgi:hypothetical protein